MQGANELNAKMRALGFQVYDPDTSMFMLGGVGVHCLSQALCSRWCVTAPYKNYTGCIYLSALIALTNARDLHMGAVFMLSFFWSILFYLIGLSVCTDVKDRSTACCNEKERKSFFIHAIGDLTCETHVLSCAGRAEFMMPLSTECSLQKLRAFLSGSGSLCVSGYEVMMRLLAYKRM